MISNLLGRNSPGKEEQVSRPDVGRVCLGRCLRGWSRVRVGNVLLNEAGYRQLRV